MIEDALIAGICSHPDDDTPRLVYADWLDENGRAEVAELIRVQCRLEANGPHDPEYADLLACEEELGLWLPTHAPGPQLKLRGGLTINGGAEWWKSSRRGFPRTIHLSGEGRARGTFAKRAGAALEKLFSRLPTRWLTVGEVSPAQLADLLREPAMERLERLAAFSQSANEDQADEMARLIAAAPTLRNLRGLLLGISAGESGIAALARADFPRIEDFTADSARFAAAEVRVLGSATWFRNLGELWLTDDFTDEGFAALVGGESFPHLHSLYLTNGAFSQANWVEFALSRSFPRLARLALCGTDLSRGRMASLASAKGFALRDLNVSRCAIGNDGAIALARSPWAGTLRILNVAGNSLSRPGARALAASPRLANLRHLTIADNPLDVGGVQLIAKGPALRKLTSLSLANPTFDADEAGARVLSYPEFFTDLRAAQLRHLDLSGIRIRKDGASALAADPRFAHLTRLVLSNCGIGDAGAAALLASPQLSELVELDLTDNRIATGAQALAQRDVLPRLGVCRLHGNPLEPELAKKLSRRRGIEL